MFVAAGYSKGACRAAAWPRRCWWSSWRRGDDHRLLAAPGHLRGLPTFVRLQAMVGVDIVGDRLRPGEVSSVTDLAPSSGATLRRGADRTGVYRDEAGDLHAVSARCAQLGCLVRFNGAERSWDCPCHGSRFDVDGAVLEGPAVEPLARKEPPS
jgi:Rieske Fe-S protein